MRKLLPLMVCALVIAVVSAGSAPVSAVPLPIIDSTTVTSPDLRLRCGNLSGDEEGRINLADISALISLVYLQGDPPPALEMANVNGSLDKKVNLADISRLVSYVYFGGDDLTCACCIHQDVRGECQYEMAEGGDEGEMLVEVVGNDLHVHHLNASYQCCLEYAVHWELEGNSLIGVESDTGAQCYCTCLFNLKSSLYDLADGEYTVSLIGIYGGMIGFDTVTIGGAEIVSYEYSGCVDQPLLSLAEDIEYNYGSDTLTMTHHNAYYNCGAEIGGFAILFTLANDTLRFHELNMMEAGMYCMCYYELGSIVGGIPPGTYVTEVYGQDGYLFGAPVELLDRRVIQIGL